MMEQVDCEYLHRAVEAMKRATPEEKAVGLLSGRKSDGTVCHCAVGFICFEFARDSRISLTWFSLKDAVSYGLVSDHKADSLAGQGYSEIARYGETAQSLPSDLVEVLGGEEDCLLVGDKQQVPISLMRLNDESELSPAEIAARLETEGLYVAVED